MKFVRFTFILVILLTILFIVLHKKKVLSVRKMPFQITPREQPKEEKLDDVPPVCSFVYPKKTYTRGSMTYLNGLPILQVTGSPSEIGDQVAHLAVATAKQVHRYPRQMFDEYVPWRQFIKNIAWRRVISKGEQLIANSPQNRRDEFEVIARQMERDLAVAANTLFDIKNDTDIELGCSSIAVLPERSATGTMLFGRNLDYPSGGYLQNYALVIVYKPTGKKAFAALTYPGLVGCLSGMNEDGLCVAVLETKALKDGTTKFTPNGIPYAFCYRRILEECATVDDVRRILPSLNIDTANNLAVCDRNGACIFEMTPDGFVERSSVNGACCCANHFCMEKFRPATEHNTNSVNRLAILQKAATKDKLGIADIQQVLDDVKSEETTLQTIVFEPSGLTMHVGVGMVPSTRVQLRKLDLSKLLK